MPTLNLLTSYNRYHKLVTRHKPDTLEEIEKQYLKPLLVVCLLLLKTNTQRRLPKIWKQLPQFTKESEVKSVIHNFLNHENIDLAKLPPSVQAALATALLTNQGIPWLELSLKTLSLLARNTKNKAGKAELQLAKQWLIARDVPLNSVYDTIYGIALVNRIRKQEESEFRRIHGPM